MTSAPTGWMMSAAKPVFRLLAATNPAAAEDELADAAGGILEFMAGLHVEVARARQRNRDGLRDPAGPRRHHHDPIGEQHRFGNRVGDEQDGLGLFLPDAHQ